MTKVRQPTSFGDAVTRVADRLGWDGAGEVVGKCERLVRYWSDPDSQRMPTLADALALDVAYMRSGGGDPPILSVYAMLLERAAAAPSSQADIQKVACSAAKEVGEAVAALVAAAMPGAGKRDREQAEKEIAEAQEVLAEAQRRLGTHAENVTTIRRAG